MQRRDAAAKPWPDLHGTRAFARIDCSLHARYDRDATYTPPIRRDSGGLAIVENAMKLRDTASFRISSTPEVMIGFAGPAGAHGEGESNDIALHRVLDIRVLPGERIVADAGLNQVMIFNSAGELKHRFL
jgi:hypothetical protein